MKSQFGDGSDYSVEEKVFKVYKVVDVAINATNASDGQVMIVYQNKSGDTFVREINEFQSKFEPVASIVKEQVV